jgi:hypothetical protein
MQTPNATTAPFYDVDWVNGRAIEVFFVDHEVARALGSLPGWFWWDRLPTGRRRVRSVQQQLSRLPGCPYEA